MYKGIDIAFWIAKQTGIKLVVAGGTDNWWENDELRKLCGENDAEFVGLIYEQRKAEIFAAAKALLFPTQVNEAFGLPVAEALMSGTPVIASDRGAMPEVLDPLGGFLCAGESDYLNAVENLAQIKSAECRQLALSRFHYRDMAEKYVREYEREIQTWSRRAETVVSALSV